MRIALESPDQPEVVSLIAALGLYGRSGYAACAPFGSYHPDALSVILEKWL
ncbi:MAG TPA: hypothetical protein VEQ17_00750 [Steroidobacteraceae bacterium]|nr:hypothetical protein [Steroidobacteraceae bacterium]